MRTTGMVMLIILAACFLNFVLAFMGTTRMLTDLINEIGISPMETMLCIVVMYLILGMFMETFSMMLTTVPVIFPIVDALGFDGVWFGILVTLLMETSLITPPIGVNLYVVHGLRTSGGTFNDVAVGAAPFVVSMIVMIGLLLVYPQIALWLPNLFYH